MKSASLRRRSSEALRAADAYERIGAMKDVEECKAILRNIEKKQET